MCYDNISSPEDVCRLAFVANGKRFREKEKEKQHEQSKPKKYRQLKIGEICLKMRIKISQNTLCISVYRYQIDEYFFYFHIESLGIRNSLSIQCIFRMNLLQMPHLSIKLLEILQFFPDNFHKFSSKIPIHTPLRNFPISDVIHPHHA